MKGPFLLSLFLYLSLGAFAQVQVDSIDHELRSITSAVNIDSLAEHTQHLADSLPALHKVDSIRTSFNLTTDSLQNKYSGAMSTIDEQSRKFNTTIDSLTLLGRPATGYTWKLDSLHQLRNSIAGKFSARLDSLKAHTTDKLRDLDVPDEYKASVEKLRQKIDGLDITTDVPGIPQMQIPGYSPGNTTDIPDVSTLAGDLPGANGIDNIPELQTPAGDVSRVTEQAAAYQDDVKDITSANIADVDNLPETIEQQASRVDGVDELQKQAGVVDEYKTKMDDYKSKVEELNNPESAKEKVSTEAKKVAVDHFAGKQEQLKAAMEKIAKYKQKYSSVSSIKDLPKRPPNPMKGKPFVERLVPGLYFQYQQKNFYLVDVNPYVGYRLTGRFTTGVGWNQRYAYDKNVKGFNNRSRIFGPRAYVDFKIGKGFVAHLEGESMNAFVPSTIHGNPDAGQREWVWSCMTGIKKEYRIYKNLKGTALIQYNIFNRYYKAPYVDRLNSRIGFEYTLKQRRKKAETK